jgi:FdhD protein
MQLPMNKGNTTMAPLETLSSKDSEKEQYDNQVDTHITHQAIHWDGRMQKPFDLRLVPEEPLSIRLQGNPYSVVMRTPGDEIPHVAGFCLGEGIVDNPDDFASLAFCDGADTNVVAVTLKPSRQKMVSEHLERRGFVSQTSCGLCGKEIIEDLFQVIKPLTDRRKIDIGKGLDRLENLSDHQPLRGETKASHAAALYGPDGALLSAAEDVGRHNALDKAVGRLFLKGNLSAVSFLVLSSRISYELVQKAARARIPVILAASRPTSLAVGLASELNMTLASLAKGAGLYVFCGEDRLVHFP